ncbi:hypothetical protein HZA98_05245 [Candidatus Woesearchaeota archaeon]|nr:hypothetical protein [Candidatus Woesearchaeota archaeon]
MKRLFVGTLLILGLVILMSFSVSAVANFSAQKGFDWLSHQAGSDGSFGSDVSQTALAVMALDSTGYDVTKSRTWLDTQLSSTFCYPSASCSTGATSFAVLALSQLQDDKNFDSLQTWYGSALSKADVTGTWNLEVVSSSTGTCMVSYQLEGTQKDISIAVDNGVFTGCGNTHFLDLDKCLQAGLLSANPGMSLDIDCGSLEGSVVLTTVYKSASTYYLLGNENVAQAQFQINNGCFGKNAGASCDKESTLYADWALSKLQSTINTNVYLKEHYDSSDAKSVALIYLATKDSSYLADLVKLQKSDGSFNRDPYTTALAVLALKDGGTYSQNVDNAKSYLRVEQAATGDWAGSVSTTAMVLFAAFNDEAVVPPTGGPVLAAECDTNPDCVVLYGDGYTCVAGSCVKVVSGAGCSSDADCDSAQVCLDSTCIKSDCNSDGKCEYPTWDETAVNCPSDCKCGDKVCDSTESSTSCASDCGGSSSTGTTSTTTTKTTSSGGSSAVFWIIFLLLIIGLGAGGYFAYKKGYLDSLLSKFKKGGGRGPQTGFGSTQSYQPFTSRIQQQKPRTSF